MTWWVGSELLLRQTALELTNKGAVWVHSSGQARERALEFANRTVEWAHSMCQADGGGNAGHVMFEDCLGRVLFVPSVL